MLEEHESSWSESSIPNGGPAVEPVTEVGEMSASGERQVIRTLDIFCGLGGSSWGARQAGATIVAGVDMWGRAIETFSENFPEAIAIRSKLESLNLHRLKRRIGDIDLLLASPECTDHTPARGSRPVDEGSRKTAYQVVRFARAFRPRWIVIENVVQMKKWSQYSKFLGRLRGLGYKICEHTLNAADFGVAQSRRRLFIICDQKRPPRLVRAPVRNVRSARTVVSLDGRFPAINTWKRKLAQRTRDKIRIASRRLGRETPFLLVYYGTDKRGTRTGGWQTLDVPLRTVTTLDRFALVRPTGKVGKTVRMLQVPELAKGMGFPVRRLRLSHGSRREKIQLLGNAVCPPVMQAIIRALTRE